MQYTTFLLCITGQKNKKLSAIRLHCANIRDGYVQHKSETTKHTTSRLL